MQELQWMRLGVTNSAATRDRTYSQMTLDEEIKAADAAIEAALQELTNARHELWMLQMRRARERFGVMVGTRVRGNRNGKELEGEVSKIDANWDRPWITIRPVKKDGTIGNNEVALFDKWELTQPIPATR